MDPSTTWSRVEAFDDFGPLGALAGGSLVVAEA